MSARSPAILYFWLVRDRDSDQDGVVDARDETILYASDLAARSLSRLSPPDSSVLDWIWNARSGEVLLQVQLASGGTKVVNARLQPAAPGSEVVVPRVLDQLQRTLDPTRAPAQENQGQPLFVPATPTNPAGCVELFRRDLGQDGADRAACGKLTPRPPDEIAAGAADQWMTCECLGWWAGVDQARPR